MQSLDPRTEALPKHGERRKVQFRVPVGVYIMLLNIEVGLMVQETVQHISSVARRAFDGSGIEWGVVVGYERIELDGKVPETRAVRAL
jgi:hypothetical protein